MNLRLRGWRFPLSPSEGERDGERGPWGPGVQGPKKGSGRSLPTTKPVLLVDTSERLQHKITFRDEATPKSRAKPAGVSDIEIWCKIGAPAPADFNDCALVATSPKNGVVVTCKGADAGKPAHYMARWKSTRGEFGPWSETVVASIGA
jgi:hypothetical protein